VEKSTDYERAELVARDLQRGLRVKDQDCQTHIVWVNGQKRFGYHVSVTRLSDGVTASKFVYGDNPI
jgi:hypothetical protein